MSFEIVFKWSGKEYSVVGEAEDTVSVLKERLAASTAVLPARQKIIGLRTRAGAAAVDTTKVSDLAIKPGTKILMMGTPEAVLQAAAPPAPAAGSPLPEVDADFDLEDEKQEEEVHVELKDRPEVKARLASRLAQVKVKVLNPAREGRKCLVMDIDYTLFDLDSSAERPEELARPFLHEFLTACYAHYDLVIWSATGMSWVEVKMKELGVLCHPNYKLVCMLDCSAMVTVQSDRHGVFNCKPLAFLWSKFPGQFTPANTVMIDDLRRNYVLNPQQGLVIRPFRKAHLTRNSDRELVDLARYFTAIASLPTLEGLDHNRWEKYLARIERRRRRGEEAGTGQEGAPGPRRSRDGQGEGHGGKP